MKTERIHRLNEKTSGSGEFVLYWMQASQRTDENHALEFAKQEAKTLGVPLVVLFIIVVDYPSANLRSFSFMLDGLRDVKYRLENSGIRFVILKGDPTYILPSVSQDCSEIITDVGYLRHQIAWRRELASLVKCSVLAVETNVVVPVETASTKEEYSAATFRRKVMELVPEFVSDFSPVEFRSSSPRIEFEGSLNLDELSLADVDQSVPIVTDFRGGQEAAKAMLQRFIEMKIDRFVEDRNDPNCDCLSQMSPFLHFGQISPCYITRKVFESHLPGTDAYIEELIVRRELSMNFAFYNAYYDSFRSLPSWAQKTLNDHRNDRRDPVYSLSQLERGETDDFYWNAAQSEMVLNGKMHGYMRMYWGKKLLEWNSDPETAIRVAIQLNDKYEIDGRDPNGYAGILWCFGKHDRAWPERPVFGKVRYMNSNGLKRKFDADAYTRKINDMITRRRNLS
ncbi:MAG TPA: deoxyribodipyrimidine photolyase [Mesotoga infera]|uniref:Deoxyribodipyrimidine photo-lyase n=1 Tax=Mesotoga infera TaxID=1236046 RepID=A0A7C1CVJ7_9BACT|nr:deoxyribodipyrimidine photolyase [Mesotoga infera]